MKPKFDWFTGVQHICLCFVLPALDVTITLYNYAALRVLMAYAQADVLHSTKKGEKKNVIFKRMLKVIFLPVC